jgi:hypothetical protein
MIAVVSKNVFASLSFRHPNSRTYALTRNTKYVFLEKPDMS